MSLLEAVTLSDNLHWAWEKVRSFYYSMDGWYDELAVAEFELRLEDQLKLIAGQFKRQRYRTAPLRPLPQPKRKDGTGVPQTRQMFWVGVADQVAWTAYLNVIGPILDSQMPPWSYGNRLYRSVWFEDSVGRQKLRIGRYRNTSGQIYRPFRQSWPVYRRHIHLTVKRLVGATDPQMMELDPAERRIFQSELKDLTQEQQLPYLRPGYWRDATPNPYWAGMDFEKFYPRLNLEAIKRIIRHEFSDDQDIVGKLLDDLLRFSLDTSGFTPDELETMDLTDHGRRFPHLPTGLMAAGFLANISLLHVDRQVVSLTKARQIAHFRYVDDHVILARDFEALQGWIKEYQELLRQSSIGVSFKEEKFEPKELREFLKASPIAGNFVELREGAEKSCTLDAKFPAPLMTQTLAKISDINRCNVDLLDPQEQDALLRDLEHLMLAEFPETELRPDTRVTFAAARIARIAAQKRLSVKDLVEWRRRIVQLGTVKEGEISPERDRLSQAWKEYRSAFLHRQRSEGKFCRRTLGLLLKAVAEFPEKIRLWQQVLSFCYHTGHTDLSGVFSELRIFRKKNSLAAEFVEASVLQFIGRQAILAGRTICSNDAPPDSRRSAWKYLRAIMSSRLVSSFPNDGHYYLNSSRNSYLSACGLAAAYVSEYGRRGVTPSKWVITIKQSAESINAWNWFQSILQRTRETKQSLAAWIWWGETKTRDPTETTPGIPWQLQGGDLSADHLESWNIWKLYPDLLPSKARTALQKAAVPIPRTQIKFLLRSLPGGASQTLKSMGENSLIDWAAWSRERAGAAPFDPRLGEWTSLEIARQASMLIRNAGRTAGIVDPRNFRVPNEWIEETSKLTWEAWRSTIDKHPLKFSAGAKIKDIRWTTDPNFSPAASELDKVSAIAVLLIGLLTRDFRWTATWNSGSQAFARSGAVRAIVAQVACSSWTTAILEGCLLPRQRETILWPLLYRYQFGEDDTAEDPPEFPDLRHLEKGLQKAEAVLVGYQISVQRHQARQMVPISLTQLTRQVWGTDSEDVEDD